jgi:hypothetical protein
MSKKMLGQCKSGLNIPGPNGILGTKQKSWQL